VNLSLQSITLASGRSEILKPNFRYGVAPQRVYEWESSDPLIVDVVVNEDKSATITAKKAGTAEIRYFSTDGEISAVCEVTVLPGASADGIIKILAIGNSFSEDALESYVSNLAIADGLQIVIGHLVIGGSSLQQHLTNATNNSAAYSYRKINVTGDKTTSSNYT